MLNLGLEAISSYNQNSMLDNSDSVLEFDKYYKQYCASVEELEHLRIIKHSLLNLGFNEKTKKFISASYHLGLESIAITEQQFNDILDKRALELIDIQNVALEGMWANMAAKIKHMFTRDSKIAEIIKTGLDKLRDMDGEAFESKTVTYRLPAYSHMVNGVKFLQEAYSIFSQYSEALKDASKSTGKNQSKEQIQSLMNKLKRDVASFVEKSDTLKKLVNFSGNVKGKTYKEAGYTKTQTVSLVSKYAQSIAGTLDKYKTTSLAVWRNCSEWHFSVGPVVNSDGSVEIEVQLWKEIKKAFAELYAFTRYLEDVYDDLDYFCYRIIKDCK